MTDIIERLSDEAKQCRNDGADDIAGLLDDAGAELARLRAEVESLRRNGQLLANIARNIANECGDTITKRMARECDEAADDFDAAITKGATC